MSYANVTAKNAPPLEQQAHPDTALLTTPSLLGSAPFDDNAKVNVVHRDSEPSTRSTSDAASGPSPPRKEREGKYSEAQTLPRWENVKDIILRPSVAGGLVGVVNIGLLAGASYAFYTHPRLRRDTKTIISTVAATFALFGAESYAAEARQGKAAKRKAREEGGSVYRRVREHALRSGGLSGVVGLLNVGVLGIVGYLAYTNWKRPSWDRRVVSATSAGLIALWGTEIALASDDNVRQYFGPK